MTPNDNRDVMMTRPVQRNSSGKRPGLNLTLHDLRRVYLNRLRQNGVSLETAMALSGHRSVTTVMKYYREVSQEEPVSAVKIIDAPVAREAAAQRTVPDSRGSRHGPLRTARTWASRDMVPLLSRGDEQRSAPAWQSFAEA